jgi:hypothetical protein
LQVICRISFWHREIIHSPNALPSMRAVSTSYSSSSHRDHLLATLLPADFALLQPHLRPMALALEQDIARPNRRIESVFFMESGIASVVATHSETRVEVGLIGCEGMSGTAVVLGGRPIAALHLRSDCRASPADQSP